MCNGGNYKLVITCNVLQNDSLLQSHAVLQSSHEAVCLHSSPRGGWGWWGGGVAEVCIWQQGQHVKRGVQEKVARSFKR